MRKANVDKLKMKLIAEDDLEAIFEAFFDEFGEESDPVDNGPKLPDNNNPVSDLVANIGAIMLATDSIQVNPKSRGRLTPYHLRDQHFYHGAMMLDGHMVMYFYFDDLDVGLVNAYGKLARITMKEPLPN